MRYALGYPVTTLDGVVEKPGQLDTFPPGLFLSVPIEGSAGGTAVVDGAITQIGRLSSPVTMTFAEGRLVRIEGGGEAARLTQLLASLEDDNAYTFAAGGSGVTPGRRWWARTPAARASGSSAGATSARGATRRFPAARSGRRSTWTGSPAGRPSVWMTR